MNNDLDYQRVIQILQKDDLDYRDIVYKIAIQNPKALVEAMDGDFEKKMSRIYSCEGMIPAIKEYRAIKQSTLKEAKDYMDALVLKHGLQKPQEYP